MINSRRDQFDLEKNRNRLNLGVGKEDLVERWKLPGRQHH